MSIYAGNPKQVSISIAEDYRKQRDRYKAEVKKLLSELAAERDPNEAGSLAYELKEARAELVQAGYEAEEITDAAEYADVIEKPIGE